MSANDALAEWLGAARGMPKFNYGFKAKQGSMNYRCAPDECFDVAEVLQHWAMLAAGAAQRAGKKGKT